MVFLALRSPPGGHPTSSSTLKMEEEEEEGSPLNRVEMGGCNQEQEGLILLLLSA